MAGTSSTRVYVVIRSDYGAWGFRVVERVYTNRALANAHADRSKYLSMETHEIEYSLPEEVDDGDV